MFVEPVGYVYAVGEMSSIVGRDVFLSLLSVLKWFSMDKNSAWHADKERRRLFP